MASYWKNKKTETKQSGTNWEISKKISTRLAHGQLPTTERFKKMTSVKLPTMKRQNGQDKGGKKRVQEKNS